MRFSRIKTATSISSRGRSGKRRRSIRRRSSRFRPESARNNESTHVVFHVVFRVVFRLEFRLAFTASTTVVKFIDDLMDLYYTEPRHLRVALVLLVSAIVFVIMCHAMIILWA